MVSVGVCFGGKEILHFIPDKTKVNAKLYVETLLPELVQQCRSVLPSGFIFRNRTPLLHTWQSWLKTGLLPTAVNSLVGLKDEWPPNSPDLNPLDSLQVISTQAGEHRWAQESSAVDMRPAVTRLNQQSRGYWASRKDFGLVWKLVMGTSNIC